MFNNINILIVLVDISFFYVDNFQNRILKKKILFLQSNLTHQQVSLALAGKSMFDKLHCMLSGLAVCIKSSRLAAKVTP